MARFCYGRSQPAITNNQFWISRPPNKEIAEVGLVDITGKGINYPSLHTQSWLTTRAYIRQAETRTAISVMTSAVKANAKFRVDWRSWVLMILVTHFDFRTARYQPYTIGETPFLA